MKRLHTTEPGGRPPANDDFTALQELALLASGGPLLLGLPTCVVHGCAVTPAGTKYNVAPGTVWVEGGLYDFPGASNVELPATFVRGATVPIDQRAYQTGGTKTCISDTKAELVAATGTTAVLDADGPVMWYDLNAARTRALGVIEMGSFDLSGYDPATFAGKGRNRGWALCYGQTIGSLTLPDMRGRFPLGNNPNSPQLAANSVGQTGGEEKHALAINEMPEHYHSFPVHDGGTVTGGYAKMSAQGTAPRSGNTNASGGNGNGQGNAEPHNNMPPYLVLAFRQWIGIS